MIKKISIKTRFGWISAFENKGKVFKVKFGKLKKQNKSLILKNFRKKLFQFFDKKKNKIRSNNNLWQNSKKI